MKGEKIIPKDVEHLELINSTEQCQKHALIIKARAQKAKFKITKEWSKPEILFLGVVKKCIKYPK